MYILRTCVSIDFVIYYTKEAAKMDEFNKCNFCKWYDSYEGCEWGCDNHESFEPVKDRLIEKAKEKGISISDLIALINLL